MDRDFLVDFARNNMIFCCNVLDNNVIDNTFIPFSGNKQGSNMNKLVTYAMGFDNWFKGVNNPTITGDELYERLLKINDESVRLYAVSRIFKTRVSYTDEWYLDSIGCRHNLDTKDHKWDNLVGGIEFDLKTTYPKMKGEYSTVGGILANPEGYIRNMYENGSSIKGRDPSERGHTDSINNRLFIVSNSDFTYLNRFKVECGYKKRWEALDYLAENMSDESVFELDVLNNNDEKVYPVKAAIMILNEVSDGKIEYEKIKKR